MARTPVAGLVVAVVLLAGTAAGQEPAPPAEVKADEKPPVPQTPVPMDRTTTFTAETLRALPRPADPWSLLRDVPGVLVDRVNVGGSDSAQQSLVVSHGDTGPGTTWTLDGVDVTDPASLGFTSIFPDMDAVSSVRVRTGALDVRVRTPGAQVALLFAEPPTGFSGSAHLRGTGDALQSDNLTADLRSRPFLRNRTDRILEVGAQAGGPLRKDRLWLWGAASLVSLKQDTFTEHVETLRTTSFVGKGRLKIGGGTLSLLALRAEKVHENRDTGFSSAPEARWGQSGPDHLIAATDRRAIGGVSLVSRLSYLDAGFRLDPPGGTEADVFQDFRGVLRGSYYTFVTDRARLQAGIEATGRKRLFGLEHDLLLGAGYRRMPVDMVLSWPGDKVFAIERRDVFFRAFRLTGFALPQRDESARSAHDQLEAYAQDTVRLGRLTVSAGARLDRLAGRNLASSVGANPVVPDELPAVSYGGASSRFRWLDVLPRAGIAWDVGGDGSLVASASYAAYAGALGSGDITFDNPIDDSASVVYFWVDRNGDRVVQAGELDRVRGRLGTSGFDPETPASTVSPHQVDAGLRSPRTHEGAFSLEWSFGPALAAGLHASARRTLHPLWAPLRNLGLGDYVIRGAVRGKLFDRDYNVGFFAPASESKIVPGDGRLLTNREGYHRDSVTVELTARGRVGGRVSWDAWGAFMDFREYFEGFETSVQDPTPLDTEPLRDGGRVAVRPGGLGRAEVFVNARWHAGATLRASLPWRFEGAALLHSRDGFPIPYFEVGNSGDPTSGSKNVLVAPRVDAFRMPALVLLDARLERGFPIGRGTLVASVDAFNVLNRSTTLQVARDIELPAFGRPREIVRPRILRVGLLYRF